MSTATMLQPELEEIAPGNMPFAHFVCECQEGQPVGLALCGMKMAKDAPVAPPTTEIEVCDNCIAVALANHHRCPYCGQPVDLDS